MKNFGKLIAAVMLVSAFVAPAYPASIVAELDEPRIGVGESTTLKIQVSGASDVKVEKVPSVPGLEISYLGMGRSIQIVNWQRTESIIFNFSVTPERKGTFQIPSFIIDADGKRLRTNEVSLIVIREAQVPAAGGSRGRIFSEISISKQRAYVGEPIVARYFLLSSGSGVTLEGFEKQPQTSGFIIKEFEENVDETVARRGDGEFVMSHIATFTLMPTSAGSYKVGGGMARVAYQVENSFFPFTQRGSLPFDIRGVEVMPLPTAGKPVSFHGDVGSFQIAADLKQFAMEMYQEKKFMVTVYGSGNFMTMSRPAFETPAAGVRVLMEDAESQLQIKNNMITGEKKFNVTVIPEKSGTIDLGPVAFSFFDPANGQYRVVRTQNVVLDVKEGAVKKKGMDFEADESGRVDFNPFLILGIILIVAGVVIFVALWEKKKYSIAVKSTGTGPVSPKPISMTADVNSLLAGAGAALNTGGSDVFLKTVDRILNASLNGDHPVISDAVRPRMEAIRDRIYRFKFGGGSITREEMEIILKEITEIIRS